MDLKASVLAGRTLREAVQTWCDPLLIEKVNRAQQGFNAGVMILYEARREDGGGNERLVLDRASHLKHIAQMKLDIEVDLRVRLERGEFHLWGVQTQPEPQLHATLIPGVWAADLIFDLDASTAQFYERRFVMVRAFEGDPAAKPRVDREKARRRAGREPFLPIITEGLTEYARRAGCSLDQLASTTRNRSEVCRAVERHIKALHPQMVSVKGGLPTPETIRKHIRHLLGARPAKQTGD